MKTIEAHNMHEYQLQVFVNGMTYVVDSGNSIQYLENNLNLVRGQSYQIVRVIKRSHEKPRQTVPELLQSGS